MGAGQKAERAIQEYLGRGTTRRRQELGQAQGPDLNHPLVLRKASRWDRSRVAVVVWIGRGERPEEAVATLLLQDLKELLELAVEQMGESSSPRSRSEPPLPKEPRA